MSTNFSNSHQELASFHHFIGEQLNTGQPSMSPEEALETWRLQNRSPVEYEADVRAIKEALDDMDAGDAGIPLEEYLAEFEKRHNPGANS